MVSLSFGTANIDTKNKSAKLFSKILHFLLFRIPEQVGNDDREAGNDDREAGNDDREAGNDDREAGNDDREVGNDDFRHSQGRRFYVIARDDDFYVIAGLTGYLLEVRVDCLPL